MAIQNSRIVVLHTFVSPAVTTDTQMLYDSLQILLQHYLRFYGLAEIPIKKNFIRRNLFYDILFREPK